MFKKLIATVAIAASALFGSLGITAMTTSAGALQNCERVSCTTFQGDGGGDPCDTAPEEGENNRHWKLMCG